MKLKILNNVVLSVLLFLTADLALASDLVFMRESEHQKHIILKSEKAEKQITTGDKWHLYPDISADANWLAWVEGNEKSLSLAIYFVPTKEKKVFQIEGYNGLLLQPKFSKNGLAVVLSAQNVSSKLNEIISLDKESIWKQTSGSTVMPKVQIAIAGKSLYFPRPSSDSGFLVYHQSDFLSGKKEVVIKDFIQNTEVIIDEGMSPNLSFDEQEIHYTKKISGKWHIFKYSRTKQTSQMVTTGDFDEMAPVLSATGDLYFASNRSGRYGLYKIQSSVLEKSDGKPLDISKWKSITSGSFDDYAPQFSGDKKYSQSLLAPYFGSERSSFGTVTHRGLVYMAGGHQGAEHTYPPESFSDQFLVFNPNTNSWKELAPRPFKAHGYQLAAHGKYIYAFGGFSYAPEYKPKWKSLDTIDRYNIKTNHWETIGKLPRARSSNVAVNVGNKIYLIGGWDSTPKFENDFDGVFHSQIDVFDLKTETVAVATFEMPRPLRRAFTGVSYKDKIVLVGGLGVGSSHFELLSKVTVIDPRSGLSSELQPLPFATFAPAAEFIENELLVFGGMFKTSPQSYEYVSHIYSLPVDLRQGGLMTWQHTGRSLRETKGFAQVIKLDRSLLGILGGHHYYGEYDQPVKTFETFGF